MNSKKAIKAVTSAVIILGLMIPSDCLYSQRTKSSLKAGDQRNAEKGLKDNRYFFYFINSSISNFGSEEEKLLFREAIQRDIISQLLYMKFMFSESFDEIRKTQDILIRLYKKTLNRDIDMTRKLLNDFAPGVIHSNRGKARHYLRLGYRDAVVAEKEMTMADNYRETLFSMRLYKYVRAIKKAKHGRRYAFLSLLEVNSEKFKRTEWREMNFNDISERIKSASDNNSHVRMHFDNYYRTPDDKSFYDMVWDNPSLTEIPEYRQYLERK